MNRKVTIFSVNKIIVSLALVILTLFIFSPSSVFAVSCSRPLSGSVTISSSCSFPETIDGVDGAASDTTTTNTANIAISGVGTTLTVNAGQVLVFGGGITIGAGTSIAINNTGQLMQTAIWYTDADADGYPTITTAQAQNTRPTNARRRAYMTTISSSDCNDGNTLNWQSLDGYTDSDSDGYGSGTVQSVCTSGSLPAGYANNNTDCLATNANIYQNVGSLITDADQEGYTTGSAGTQCVGGTTSVGGRTYYRNSAGAYTWLTSSQALGSSDCNDGDNTKWQNLTGYQDSDGDTYTTGGAQSVCSGSSLPSGWQSSANADCNDADSTRWRNRYYDSDNDAYGTGSLVCVGNHAQYVDNASDVNDAQYCPDGYNPSGTCDQCSSGGIANQSLGSDVFSECASQNCSSYTNGWNGNDCKAAAATSYDGDCYGSGSCATFSQACTDGGTLASCGSSGCKKTCPSQGSPTSSYNSTSEVCYTDNARHSCSLGYGCNSSGTCVDISTCRVNSNPGTTCSQKCSSAGESCVSGYYPSSSCSGSTKSCGSTGSSSCKCA